jgi:hypothetical protein
MELSIVLLALVLAFMAESLVEYFLGWAFDLWKSQSEIVKKAEPLKYVAAIVGLALAFAYRVDLIAWALKTQPEPAWVGIALTGMALGRGANFMHDFLERLGVKFSPEQQTTTTTTDARIIGGPKTTTVTTSPPTP